MKKYISFTDGPFNQGYLTQFKVMGTIYVSAEQYMMAYKALVFGDTDTFNLIMKETDYAALKALGRQVKGFDKTVWEAECDRIVYEANKAKFTQNIDLYLELLGTHDNVLVYEADDAIWGNGKDGNGQNKLGKTLTILRDVLIHNVIQ
jgi:ribA/ribD-fused uncharacterized protein